MHCRRRRVARTFASHRWEAEPTGRRLRLFDSPQIRPICVIARRVDMVGARAPMPRRRQDRTNRGVCGQRPKTFADAGGGLLIGRRLY